MADELKIGDSIEAEYDGRFVRGIILELDTHPFGSSYAKLLLDSPALPAPQIWVNLRLARRDDGRRTEGERVRSFSSDATDRRSCVEAGSDGQRSPKRRQVKLGRRSLSELKETWSGRFSMGISWAG